MKVSNAKFATHKNTSSGRIQNHTFNNPKNVPRGRIDQSVTKKDHLVNSQPSTVNNFSNTLLTRTNKFATVEETTPQEKNSNSNFEKFKSLAMESNLNTFREKEKSSKEKKESHLKSSSKSTKSLKNVTGGNLKLPELLTKLPTIPLVQEKSQIKNQKSKKSSYDNASSAGEEKISSMNVNNNLNLLPVVKNNDQSFQSVILPKISSSEASTPVNNPNLHNISYNNQISSLDVIKESQMKKLDSKKFMDIHSKNLDLIRLLNKKLEEEKIRATSTEGRPDKSLDRLRRIQKFFNNRKEENKENAQGEEKKEGSIQNIQNNQNFTMRNLHNNREDKIYYYSIIPGNNSELVKNCFSHRVNWKESLPAIINLASFRWQQNNHGVDFSLYDKLSPHKQMFNHFEYHKQISNKLNLFINMMKYCESKSLDVFQYMPMTILIQYDSQNFLRQFQNFKDFFNEIQQHVVNNETLAISNSSPRKSKLRKYTDFFSFNFTTDKLGAKTNLYVSPSHYVGRNIWILKAVDLNRGRCIKLGDSLEKIEKIIKKFYYGMYLNFKESEKEVEKIVEEAGNSNNGSNLAKRERGSPNKKEKSAKKEKLENNLNENIEKLISTQPAPGSPGPHPNYTSPKKENKYKSSTVIIQKYIEKPLLYKGRKFDIRLWVLLTPKLELYVFKEGHLKASSVPFDINKIDSFIHLTNYSVQKYNGDFSKYEIGNEISFKEYQDFLNTEYANESCSNKNNIESIFNSMCEVVKITMLCVKDKINVFERKYCFEIFGYDFILDTDFKPYLLEVNTNPGLEESSPLIKSLVPRMIDDALRLTVDNVFNTKYSFPGQGQSQGEKNITTQNEGYQSPYKVDGYSDNENLWQYICEIKDSREKLEANLINSNNYKLVKKKNI
jgi:hypothetical protein